MNLSTRAAAALRAARAADPALDTLTPNSVRWRIRGRLARLTAGILGVDPAQITVTDDPDRVYGGHPGYLITLTDDTTVYRFVPRLGDDDTLLLLVDCIACGQPVTTAEIRSLVDLGRYLHDNGAEFLSARDHDIDPAHAPTCRHRTT